MREHASGDLEAAAPVASVRVHVVCCRHDPPESIPYFIALERSCSMVRCVICKAQASAVFYTEELSNG